jgi:hypothetical protein
MKVYDTHVVGHDGSVMTRDVKTAYGRRVKNKVLYGRSREI